MSSYEEGNDSKLMRKVKENPFVPLGEYVLFHGNRVKNSMLNCEVSCL